MRQYPRPMASRLKLLPTSWLNGANALSRLVDQRAADYDDAAPLERRIVWLTAYCAAAAPIAACCFALGFGFGAVAVLIPAGLTAAVFAAGGLTASALAVSAGFGFTTGFGASGHTIGAEASLAAIRS